MGIQWRPQFEELLPTHLTKIILPKVMPPNETSKKSSRAPKSRRAPKKLFSANAEKPTDNKTGRLQLDVVNVYGKHVGGKVSIHFRNSATRHYAAIEVDASRTLLIPNLYASPEGHYWIQVSSTSYRPIGRFVNIRAGGITELRVILPIDSATVKRAEFPRVEMLPEHLQIVLKNSKRVLSYEGKTGKRLYSALDDLRKANLWNTIAKACATWLSNGETLLSYIKELRELRADRIFAIASREVLEEVRTSEAEGLLCSVSDVLRFPPPGFARAGSFKTLDHYGVLQLTFFLKENVCCLDMEIDDANGIEHIFQSLRGSRTDRPNSFDIHEILMAYQAIDPGYALVL